MRIHIAYLQGATLRDYERKYVPRICDELRQYGGEAGVIVEENPARADLVVIWEGFEYKTPEYIGLLESDLLIRNHADRICTINYDDHPEGFLAGLYTSLEAPFFDPSIHRIWPFFEMNNIRVYDLAREQLMGGDSKWLFSFTGAVSHPVRKHLFNRFAEPSSEYHVEHIDKWYNHGENDRQHFIDIALASVFCLCPHGYCSYTPRITEVMAMARVPVVIADDWIPISFDEDLPYYVKVPEKDLDHLPEILRDRRKDAEELRRNARTLWEKHCSLQRRMLSTVERLSKLAARPEPRLSYQDYRERWHSKEFLTKLGWTAPQRLALRVEQHVRRWLPSARIPSVSNLMRYRNAPNLK